MRDRPDDKCEPDEVDYQSLARASELADLVEDLPALPQVLVEALELLDGPEPEMASLRGLFAQEPALTARVLKTANSPALFRGVAVKSIAQALVMLGLAGAKKLVLSACLDTLRQKPAEAMSADAWTIRESVWRNAICTAVAAERLAREKCLSFTEDAFVYGLLHDLGKLALIQVLPKEYVRVVAERDRYGSLAEAEVELLGVSHSLFGAVVGHAWRLPVETCEVIRLHHRVFKRPFARSYEEKAALVRTADLIAHYLDPKQSSRPGELLEEIYIGGADFALETTEMEELLAIIAEEYVRCGVA